MKSFNESLQITKNMKLIEEAMILLQKHGISALSFLEWIERDAVYASKNNCMNESLNVWLSEQGDFTSNSPHIDINKATIDLQNALKQLVSRAQTSEYLRQTVSNPMFSQNINALVNSLRDNLQQRGGMHGSFEYNKYFKTKQYKDHIRQQQQQQFTTDDDSQNQQPQGQQTQGQQAQGQQAQGQQAQGQQPQGQQPQPSMMDKLSQWQQDQQNQQKAEKQKQTQADNFDSGGGSYDPDNSRSMKDENNYIKGYLNLDENKKDMIAITKTLQDFAKSGINPQYVFESYLKSIRYRMDESLFKSIGDFLGRQKVNLTNFVAGRGYSGGEQHQFNKDQPIDDKLINDIKQKLMNLNKAMRGLGIVPTKDFQKYSRLLQIDLNTKKSKMGMPKKGRQQPQGQQPQGQQPQGQQPQGQQPQGQQPQGQQPQGQQPQGQQPQGQQPQGQQPQPSMMDKLSQWQQDQQNQQKAEKQKQTQADNFDSGGGSYDPDNSRSTKDENNYIKGYLHSEQSNSENKVFLESILGKVRNTKKTWLN